MIYYKALAGGAQKDNRNTFVGGTGGWAGRLILLTNRNKHNATAFASLRGLYAGEASVGVGVFGNANDIAFISGLTYCMGVAIAVRGPGNQFSEVSVAHFNGGYDHAGSWAAIRAGVLGAAGTPYGFIVLTSDSTSHDFHVHAAGPANSLRAALQQSGVADQNILCYHSTTSGVAFGIRANGDYGELTPGDQWVVI